MEERSIMKLLIGIIIGFFLTWYFPIEDEIESAFNNSDRFLEAVMNTMNEVKEDNSVSE